jgi:UDP-glucose/iron transport system ATP-binding protein
MLRVNQLRSDHYGPIDLSVAPGTCLGLSGASGAGKTVLLRGIVDLDPNTGTVSWKGAAREAMPAPVWRRMVGYVPAETAWWADDVATHFDDADGARPIIEAVGLPPEALGWEVARLSTGERHRLGLVRALMQRPEVLLLDEPTAPLDAEATGKVEALLKRELAEGKAIILVSHDARQIARLAQSAVRIADGRIADVDETIA